jgi:hypothetical protein
VLRDKIRPAGTEEEAMHPYISEAVMSARVSERHQQAAAQRLARQARKSQLAQRRASHAETAPVPACQPGSGLRRALPAAPRAASR